MMLEMQVHAWDMHNNLAWLYQLMGPRPCHINNWISSGITYEQMKKTYSDSLPLKKDHLGTITKMNYNMYLSNIILFNY